MMGFLFYTLMIRPLDALNKKISNIVIDDSFAQSSDQTKNEFKSIESKFNTLVNYNIASKKTSEDYFKNEIKLLEDKNDYLQREISISPGIQNLEFNDYLLQFGKVNPNNNLPNGVMFNEILNRSINYSKRRKQLLAILLIEIDTLKLYEESKENIDLIFNEIGKRYSNVLRKEDVLAKLDGCEFIVLLSDIVKSKFASMVSEKILTASSHVLKIDDKEYKLTASIGISIYPSDGKTLEELIENANKALFESKNNGGNTFHFYKEEMDSEAKEYIQLESALRTAIFNNELALYYQPKYRIKTGTITGVEALMRWENSTLGIINPAKFIALAEECGLIMQIGEWALLEACKRIRYWQNDGYPHLTMAIKISKKQFYHPEIIKTIEKVFKSVNINPRFLEFEINENTIMENIESAAEILENLKSLGMQISIDHFGVGYTSINYLKRLPISSIKIDKSYIHGVPNNPNDTAITSAIIALAHHLGLEVIAEGVESAEQIQFLSRENCDIVQGYFLGHPLSAQNLALQLKKLQEEVMI